MGWGSVYIPDLTERFPEGFGGVDLTDSYFPSFGSHSYLDAFAYMEQDLDDNIQIPREIEEDR